MLNVVFLMVVAFIPFPTRLLADHLRDDGAQAAALAYGINLTLTAATFNAVWFYASIGRKLIRSEADGRVVRGISRTYVLGPWIYLAATLTAFINPIVAAILFAAFALFWVLESSLFGRRG